uniref:(northern house mosquito) hypothetical protein n=1 Tax=Culex pipiens TaxID=7175 RepID=A0A8D8K2C6_CULPI
MHHVGAGLHAPVNTQAAPERDVRYHGLQNIPILTVGSGQDLRQGDAAAVELAVRSEGHDHAASREPNIGGRPDAGGTGRAGAAILGFQTTNAAARSGRSRPAGRGR